MKKIFGIALVLALVAILAFGSTASAWDYEDPEVVANEDMWGGRGIDYDTGANEWHWGGDGYNLYQDDGSGAGHLDYIAIWLKGGMNNWLRDENPDTWYWAEEPRGYDEPEPKPSPIIASYIQIWLPDGKFSIQRNGNRRYAPIDVNDGTWRFQLAPNVLVWDGKFGGAAERIIIGEDGQVANDVWFQRGEPIITRWEP
ncbi:unnamed protein product [marine sediment metagenome]|uniref:Uncharacterized protein n=1 Tax=marine sediment metagenome TaxID=412755 RepID=X1QWE8_9ZZZZ